jgi:hypothetical protein
MKQSRVLFFLCASKGYMLVSHSFTSISFLNNNLVYSTWRVSGTIL